MESNNDEYYLKIKPVDNLFFNDSHVFKEELSNFLPSMNMPMPSVLYGAIVSAFLREGMLESVKYKIKHRISSLEINKELSQRLRIEDIFIYDESNCYNKKIYVKAPMDIYTAKEGIKYCKYKNENVEVPYSKYGKCTQVSSGYIAIEDLLTSYVEKRLRLEKIIKEDSFFKKFRKVGIKLDYETRVSEDKHLYRLDLLEFVSDDMSYLVKISFDGQLEKTKFILKLGGEGKMATAEVVKKVNTMIFLDDMKEQLHKYEGKVKVLLTTPLPIKEYSIFKDKNKILCAVTGKRQMIGGFDMVANVPKPLISMIPAGSVFIMDYKGEDNISKALFSDLSYKGFGKVIVMPMEELYE